MPGLLFNGYSMDPSGGAHREHTQLRLCPHYLWSSGGCLSSWVFSWDEGGDDDPNTHPCPALGHLHDWTHSQLLITPLVVHSLGRSEALSQRKRLSCLFHPCLRIQGLYSVICHPLKTQRARGLWEQRQEISHCHSRSEMGSWTLAP